MSQNIRYGEETPIRQVNQNGIKIHNTRNDTNNINTEHNRVMNNYIENDRSNNNSNQIVGNKEKSECQKFFFEPDCCFCSNSCCCNCRDSNNYPEINASNALFFTIISELAILSIILFLKNGHDILSFIEDDKKNDIYGILLVSFSIEIFIYLPFVISCLPYSKSDYPSWASENCCKTIFSLFTCLLCCCCSLCCCNRNDLFDFTSKCIRYIYKTVFYFSNILFIPIFSTSFCSDKDKIIEQRRIAWVFYVILSFLVIDIFSFIHVIIYGKRINPIRNSLFGVLGFLISVFVYLKIFGKKECGYLLIPTAYYYIINNYFILIVKKKWQKSLYPLYASVGYFFVFLALPILLYCIALLIFNQFCECCNDTCDRTQRRSSVSSNNTPSPPIQPEESYNYNDVNENN